MTSYEAEINHVIKKVTDDFLEIPNPATRAKIAAEMLETGVPRLQVALRETRQAAVAELRAKGMTFAEIGTEIGVTRARAKQIFDGDSRNARGRRAGNPSEA